MKVEKKESRYQTLLLPIFALIGVILGAIVTGIFHLQTQRVISEKDLSIETYKGSRELQSSLLKSANEYLSILFQMSGMDKSEIATEDGLKQYLDFQKKGLALGLITSFPTTQKIMKIQVTLIKLTDYKMGSEERKKLQNKFAKEYGELYFALYGEVAKYRYRSTQKSLEDELKLSIGQLILNREK